MADESQSLVFNGSWTYVHGASQSGGVLLMDANSDSPGATTAFIIASFAALGYSITGNMSAVRLQADIWLETSETPSFYPALQMLVVDGTNFDTFATLTPNVTGVTGLGDPANYDTYDSGWVTLGGTLASALDLQLIFGASSNPYFGVFHVQNAVLSFRQGTVSPPANTITPSTATIQTGQTVHLVADQSSHWGVTGNTGNNSGGTVTTGGGYTGDNGTVAPDGGLGSADTGATYTAPNTPGVYTVNAVNEADGSDIGTAEITVTEPDPVPVQVVEMPALSRPFFAFLFDGFGQRKKLPPSRFLTVDWGDERYGGFTGFTVTAAINLADEIPAEIGDYFEFWWIGERRYRGWVTSIEIGVAEPDTINLTGYGIAYQAGKAVINQALVYSAATDIARAFADICRKFVSPNFISLIIYAQAVGVLIQQIDSTYKQVTEVLNDLCQNQGENLALWGGDFDSDGNDRLYVKPFNTVVDWGIKVPGPNTTAGKSSRQGADIVNRLTILGGSPRYPNLVYNSSFERPRFSGDSEGNILLNADFEAATDWSGSGGYVTAGVSEGSAYTGTRMWQTEGSGKNGTQAQNPAVVPIVPGWDYVISANARAETSTSTAAGRITVVWKAAGGSTLQTDTLDIASALAGGGLSTIWQTFQKVARAPVGATGYSFEVKTQSGGGSGSGIHWDACELAPNTILYQDKWEADVLGAASINALNWAYADGIDGGYCVWADISAGDSDASEGYIQPLAAERFAVQGGTTYNASVFLKSPPGVTGNGKLFIEVNEYDANGNLLTVTRETIAAGGGWSDWTQEYGAVTVGVTTTHAYMRLVWRSSTVLLVDGFCFRDSAAGLDFIRDGQFTYRIQCTDIRLTGISDDAADSISLYGAREATETVESISTIEDAIVFATAYFNIYAVPVNAPTVELVNDDRWFRPGQLVRLIGPLAAKLMQGQASLPIVKASWKWDGKLNVTLELSKEQPDLLSLFKKDTKRLLTGAGAGSFSGGSGGTSGSIIPAPTSSSLGNLILADELLILNSNTLSIVETI